MSEKICRLCLQTINNENCQAIEESLLKTLKLNLNVCNQTVMCIDCATWLQVFSNFTPVRVYMGDGTLPSSDFQNDIKLEPVEMDATSNRKSLIKTEIKCSFCAETHDREDLISVYGSKENKFLVNMLERYILETNLKNTEVLLTCRACLEALRGVLSFISKCLEVEEKISKYIEVEGADDKGQIELKDVQQFMFKPIFKLEIESFGVNELEDGGDQTQEEFITMAEAEIKYEDEVNNTELVISAGDGHIKSERPDCDITDIKSEGSDCDGLQELFIEHEIPNDPLHMPMDTSDTRKCKERIEPHLLTPKGPSNIKIFNCELCSYETKYRQSIKNHLLIHKSPSEINMLKCELCSFETKYKGNLKTHLLTHKSPSEINMFKCNICSFETKRKNRLDRHFLTHKSPAETEMFKCTLCSHETKHKFGLKAHLLTHEKRLPIEICNLSSRSNPPEIKMFKCTLCSFETKYKSCLKDHLLTHKNPCEIEWFKCDLCSYEAKRKCSIKEHLLTHKNPEEINMIKCELCPYKAKRPSYLKRHLLTHKSPSEINMFKCEMCPYQAKRKSHVQTHLLTHTKPKMFKCDSCSFKAKQQWYFQKHLLTHKTPSASPSEINMLKCEMCPYQAKHKYQLETHLLTHTNPVKLFKCHLCSFKVKQQWYFKKHLLTHKNLVDIKTESCDTPKIDTLHKYDS